MNNKNIKNINTQVYSQKVELLLRLIPIVVEEGVFAIHGGKVSCRRGQGLFFLFIALCWMQNPIGG